LFSAKLWNKAGNIIALVLTRHSQILGRRNFRRFGLTPPDIECKKLERLATACLKNAEDKLAIYVLPRADYLDIVSLGMGEITQDFTWRLI
jgi:hypothetical protein